MLKVYGFARVNAMARGHTRDLRVLWALEEMQVPFEIVGLDHPAQELGTEAYRRINPFQQIPAIDDDGVVLTESAAILIYLARKFHRLIPQDLAGEAQVMRWSFAAMNSLEIPLMALLMIDWVEEAGACGKHREHMRSWAARHLTGLERWLEGREYIATDSFTVADILMAHVLSIVKDPSLITPYARVQAYRDRMFARPAWQRARESYDARVEAA